MKFQISQHELSSALARVGGVIPKKASMPILEMVLLKTGEAELCLTGTNLETTIKTQASCQINAPGECLIAFSLLNEIVGKLSGELVVEVADGKVKITAGLGKYNLPAQAAEEYPNMVFDNINFDKTINADHVRAVVNDVSFCASDDMLRPALMGMLFEFSGSGLTAVATDGHRIAKTVFANYATEPLTALIPVKVLQLIVKVIGKTTDINFCIGEQHIHFEIGDTKISAQLFDHKFPKYESVIPAESTMEYKAEINRETFLAAINRAGIFANNVTHQVQLIFSTGICLIKSSDAESGGEAQEEIACKYFGEPLVIGYNSRLLAEALSHMPTDTVIMKFKNPKSVAFILPDTQKSGEDYKQLLMPINLEDK